MGLLVQKFGGTSLATLAHINQAANIVCKAKQAGYQVVVIVSAMSGETDRLIDLANSMSESPNEREYAVLVSTGEQVSMALMAMALINRGIEARSYTGAQARIQTGNQFKKACIQAIDIKPIQNDLAQNKVVVIAGFQGVDSEGNITTLGRGGSDATAVAIAAALNADECQIYTDVDGVYTADPRMVTQAKRLEQISFAEMLELSSSGAKVLQIRAVEFAGKYQVPLRVLSSFHEGQGTLITYPHSHVLDKPSVTGIAFSRHEAKLRLLGIPNSPEVSASILSEITALGINVDMFVQHLVANNKTDFIFTVHRDEYQVILSQLKRIAKQFHTEEPEGVDGLARLSLVGAGLKSNPEVISLLFKTFATHAIPIQFIATSEIKVSVLMDTASLEGGVRALHHAFQLEENSYGN